MRPFARFVLGDGSLREVHHGDFIGRSPRAGLSLNEPTLSEAHALVSLRGSQLRLLALRGRMTVAGRAANDIALRPGLRIALSSRVSLLVDEVSLPAAILALEGEALPQVPVSGVCSVVLEPTLEVRPGARAEAAALVWVQEDQLWVRREGLPDAALSPGATLALGDGIRAVALRVVAVPLRDAAVGSTIDDGLRAAPLIVRVRYDTVHIETSAARTAESICVLDGKNARVVSELALMGVPCDWEVVAREVWPEPVDTAVLRERWDATLGRIRRRLREAGVRSDLVRATRSGQVELNLGPRDRVANES